VQEKSLKLSPLETHTTNIVGEAEAYSSAPLYFSCGGAMIPANQKMKVTTHITADAVGPTEIAAQYAHTAAIKAKTIKALK